MPCLLPFLLATFLSLYPSSCSVSSCRSLLQCYFLREVLSCPQELDHLYGSLMAPYYFSSEHVLNLWLSLHWSVYLSNAPPPRPRQTGSFTREEAGSQCTRKSSERYKPLAVLPRGGNGKRRQVTLKWSGGCKPKEYCPASSSTRNKSFATAVADLQSNLKGAQGWRSEWNTLCFEKTDKTGP